MKDSKKFWDKQAKKFSSSGNKESIKLVEKTKLYLPSGAKVLDFACGSGQSTELLSRYSKEVIGIDYSEEMIHYANENKNSHARFLVGSLDHHELKEETFDLVTAFNVLHLLDDIEGIANRIHDLLKPGGIFISYTACVGENKSVMTTFIKFLSKLGIFPKVNPLSVSMLDRLVLKSGFEIVLSEIEGDSIHNYFLVLRKGD